jgi:hypothetical protein
MEFEGIWGQYLQFGSEKNWLFCLFFYWRYSARLMDHFVGVYGRRRDRASLLAGPDLAPNLKMHLELHLPNK